MCLPPSPQWVKVPLRGQGWAGRALAFPSAAGTGAEWGGPEEGGQTPGPACSAVLSAPPLQGQGCLFPEPRAAQGRRGLDHTSGDPASTASPGHSVAPGPSVPGRQPLPSCFLVGQWSRGRRRCLQFVWRSLERLGLRGSQ